MPKSFRLRPKSGRRIRENSSSNSSDFLKHPITILVIGFIFTTIIGSFLTYYYQRAESIRQHEYQKAEAIRQQEYLVRQKYLDYKISSIEEVLNGIGDSIAACNDIAKLLQFAPLPKDEDRKSQEGWYQSSRNWRINQYKYAYKIEMHFDNEEIIKTFQEMLTKRRLLGNAVTGLLVDYVNNPKEALRDDNEEIKTRVSNTLKKIDEFEEMAIKLRTLMVKEIRETKSPTLQTDSKLPEQSLQH